MEIVEPVRVQRSYVQKLRGKPRDVFPLLCPVREKEWSEGWDPLAVYTHSGFAEPGCIFITGEEKPDSIWIITVFDPARFKLEILKVTPGMTVGKIEIAMSANETGNTDALVKYMYTAISPEGEEFVRAYSEDFFQQFMQYSESELNHYLERQERGDNGNR